jgi:hypothetical protein
VSIKHEAEVFLTRAELRHAMNVALDRAFKHRYENGERKGTTYRTGRKLPDIIGEMLGTVAECAVAKYYGTKWNDVPWDLSEHKLHTKAPDVEPNFEVRRVNSEDGYLSIRGDDEKSKVAVLAYVHDDNPQHISILGAIQIEEAMDRSIPASQATPSDYFTYSQSTDSYLVNQLGLYHPTVYTPVPTA